MVSKPLSKFSRLKCSFGACRFSSGKPKPISTAGADKILDMDSMIGKEPPSLVKTALVP
ncbi:hypothetical protein D3C77_632770 [compost metagenome]